MKESTNMDKFICWEKESSPKNIIFFLMVSMWPFSLFLIDLMECEYDIAVDLNCVNACFWTICRVVWGPTDSLMHFFLNIFHVFLSRSTKLVWKTALKAMDWVENAPLQCWKSIKSCFLEELQIYACMLSHFILSCVIMAETSWKIRFQKGLRMNGRMNEQSTVFYIWKYQQYNLYNLIKTQLIIETVDTIAQLKPSQVKSSWLRWLLSLECRSIGWVFVVTLFPWPNPERMVVVNRWPLFTMANSWKDGRGQQIAFFLFSCSCSSSYL